MRGDSFDILLWTALVVIIATLSALPFIADKSVNASAALKQDKAQEQVMLLHARRSYLQQQYEPAEALRKLGQYPQALLKLEELSRNNPGEAYGFILRGEVLSAMGAPKEALASFAEGVRLDGSYIDKSNLLSRRESISRLVSSELATTRSEKTYKSSENDKRLRDLRYLQSRLAGGCE